ncbi:acyltransferase family protein [Streptomyces sp. M41]|uniref:acyltransferase family protein n=1 Tax=Streptomyces sp. M41 TaxID=3059412 RepID=UPI00374D356D
MSRLLRLDALRGLAVLLVMVHHGAPDLAPGSGVVGVVVFFTLSGHLITALLLRELDATGRIRLRSFYRRRAVRLLPAFLAFVTVFAAVTYFLDPLHERSALPRALAIALTYTADLPILHGSNAIFHLWTLAVEQQFYLLWPPLLAYAWQRHGAGRLVTAGIAALSLAAVGITLHLGHNFDLAYPWPTSWSATMLIGAAHAIATHHRRSRHGRPAPTRLHADTPLAAMTTAAAPIAVLLLVAAGFVPWRAHPITYPWGGLALAALTLVVLDRYTKDTSPAGRTLVTLARLGTISYAAYLWNYPLTLWLRPWHPAAGPALAAALTLVCATLSWFLVERPIALRWSRSGALSGARHAAPSVNQGRCRES